MKWLHAIWLVLLNPAISTEELARKIGIVRQATVRTMTVRIRDALSDPKATELFAGLDALFEARDDQAVSSGCNDKELFLRRSTRRYPVASGATP